MASKENTEFNFGWGEPYCVRDTLVEHYPRKINLVNINGLQYALDEGAGELVNLTRDFIKLTTGINYKHVLITNGATGAINVVMRVLKTSEGRDICYTHRYHFPFYKRMVPKNGYEMRYGLYKSHELELANDKAIGLVDSPTNPEGFMVLYSNVNNNVIWDSVYHNDVYINTIPVVTDHRVNCGSYSKAFGIPGARIGWIATNCEADFLKFKDENLHENCTISVPSQELITDIIKETDVDTFMLSARYKINNNRENFRRIEYLFDGQQVSENGMFYCAWANKTAIETLDKIGVTTVKLDQLGDDSYLRFSLGQKNDTTRKMITTVIKEDKRQP